VTTNYQALLAGLEANRPLDINAYLVIADYLDDAGEHDRAWAWRWMHRKGRRPKWYARDCGWYLVDEPVGPAWAHFLHWRWAESLRRTERDRHHPQHRTYGSAAEALEWLAAVVADHRSEVERDDP
jgi:hypothetical protein